MSNTNAPESAAGAITTETPPALPVVKPSEGQPNSAPSIDVAALTKQIKAEVQEDLKRDIRAAQSDRDRRLDGWEKDKGKMEEIYAYVKKYPDNPDQAFREMRVDQMLKGQQEPESSSALPGKVAPKKNLEQKALDTLVKSGIVDPTEQLEVRQAWAEKAPPGGFDSDEDALAGMTVHMAEFLVAKSKRQAPASAAAAIAPRGTATPEVDLKSEYIQKMRANRGKRDVLQALRVEYENKGVDVHNIDFS